jgi:DNA-binding NarL/FixJ family response regulator
MGQNQVIEPAIAVPAGPRGFQAGEVRGDRCLVRGDCLCRRLRSDRERQILHCLMSGRSEKEIGVVLGISRNTVHCHVSAIYRHFSVRARAELMARVLMILVPEMLQCASASAEA